MTTLFLELTSRLRPLFAGYVCQLDVDEASEMICISPSVESGTGTDFVIQVDHESQVSMTVRGLTRWDVYDTDNEILLREAVDIAKHILDGDVEEETRLDSNGRLTASTLRFLPGREHVTCRRSLRRGRRQPVKRLEAYPKHPPKDVFR